MSALDHLRDARGEPVVVAEADLGGGDRVVLVDHRHRAQRQQLREGRAGVEMAAALLGVVGGQQDLRDGDAVPRQRLLIGVRQADLPGRRGGLLFLEPQRAAGAGRDGGGRPRSRRTRRGSPPGRARGSARRRRPAHRARRGGSRRRSSTSSAEPILTTSRRAAGERGGRAASSGCRRALTRSRRSAFCRRSGGWSRRARRSPRRAAADDLGARPRSPLTARRAPAQPGAADPDSGSTGVPRAALERRHLRRRQVDRVDLVEADDLRLVGEAVAVGGELVRGSCGRRRRRPPRCRRSDAGSPRSARHGRESGCRARRLRWRLRSGRAGRRARIRSSSSRTTPSCGCRVVNG